MKTPPALKKGDRVALISSSNYIPKKEIKDCVEVIESWGLKPVIGKTIGLRNCCFAGSDQERLKELQNVMDDESIKAIFQTKGGYGLIKIIDELDTSRFKKVPKWIAGYSDTTYLHNHLQTKLKIESIHSTMAIDIVDNSYHPASWNSLKNILFGQSPVYRLANHPLNIKGHVEGELVGGNLSILCNLTGTNCDIDTDNKILFIEEIKEHLYHLDGYMISLKKAGKFKKLKGLIVGRFTKMIEDNPPYGISDKQIIYDALKEFNFPICFGFPAGHTGAHKALIFGRKVSLNVGTKNTTIEFEKK